MDRGEASPRTNSRALPVVVVNLTITLAGKLLLIRKCSDGLDSCQALAEVSIHRRAGGCITSLQFYIGAAVVLLEEEVHNHEGNHACNTVTVLKQLLGQKALVWEGRLQSPRDFSAALVRIQHVRSLSSNI